jgi:hypothetical protein
MASGTEILKPASKGATEKLIAVKRGIPGFFRQLKRTAMSTNEEVTAPESAKPEAAATAAAASEAAAMETSLQRPRQGSRQQLRL